MHLKQTGPTKLHISHLMQYVSAYHRSPNAIAELEDDLINAVRRADSKTEAQIVSQDGEMFFIVYPSGTISLCLQWKDFEIVDIIEINPAADNNNLPGDSVGK